VPPSAIKGKRLYDLGDGQWDIPKLRLLLGKILPEQGAMEDYEVEHDFPSIGRRTMLLNARKIVSEKGSNSTILLGIEDVPQKRTPRARQSALLLGLQRRFDRFPLPLGLVRGLGCDFGRGQFAEWAVTRL
jgi:hypothetical protein